MTNWDRDKEKKAGKAMAIGGSIFAIAFVLVWCILAASMGGWFMLLFGVPMLGLMIYRLYILLRYTGEAPKTRTKQEIDSWEQPAASSREPEQDGRFCPYCGFALQEDFEFCPKCGRRQP